VLAAKALGSVGGENGQTRQIEAKQLEVAVLDRRRRGRAFRRITGAALITLLHQGTVPEQDLGETDAAPPSHAADKPTVSAASVDAEGADATEASEGTEGGAKKS
jgi:proteasome alpha subunit